MKITRTNLASNFDPATFKRGEKYARDGMVIQVYAHGSRVTSAVEGNGGDVYEQTIRLQFQHGELTVNGQCTCPVAYNCKHVVAALLSIATDSGGLSREVSDWLDDAADIVVEARRHAAPAKRHELIYVLVPDERTGLPELQVGKVRRSSDGENAPIISVAIVHTLDKLLDDEQQKMQACDQEFLIMSAAVIASACNPQQQVLAGALGARLLDQLCAAGRLFFSPALSDLRQGIVSPIAHGPSRHALLVWVEQGGMFSLEWQFDDGDLIEHILDTEPPMYLDQQTLGALTLPLNLAALPFFELLDLVADAPLLPAAHCTAMAARLRERGLDALLPLPPVQLQAPASPPPRRVEVDDWIAELREGDAQEEGVNAWFALELGILVEGQRHALLPLLLQMMRRAPYDFDVASIAARDDSEVLLLDLPDHSQVALPWQRIKPILKMLSEMHFGEREESFLRLPLIDAARLAELEQAARLRWFGGERLRELGRQLHDVAHIDQAPLPAGLQAQLRPYQHTGLSWMQFLRAHGFGGILADDMGLGKTVQALAHILVEKEAGRLDCPALVVAPTSLMSNWQAEAARFAPGLRVLLLHGKDRAGQFEHIGAADLLLTTYALLPRDEAILRQHQFHLLILDEAQYIKNSKSKAAQTASLLKARQRLCLTGTPVQNHLGELWSQFHFLMPGLLGDERTFNIVMRKPIEQQGDSHSMALLARRINPFMLRRTKDKVAAELPPKTEIVLQVDFGAAQRDLYETVRVAMHKKVRDEIDRRGLARSHIIVLDALLKLRQVCCDPRLLKKQASSAGSAKLDTLMELLGTLLSEGRKVLVFSQFTSMLALIGERLREQHIDYALLTGDTVERAAEIATFQNGPRPVFLISLKAGGVGLNLTAADSVIHYDPWWNPASENQASDRAWRIGQTQPVFVYKLIARGTLEEKIQEMQQRKGALADAVFSSHTGPGQGMDAEELQALFALPA
jgi:superfamily II DNA or RNA helicase